MGINNPSAGGPPQLRPGDLDGLIAWYKAGAMANIGNATGIGATWYDGSGNLAHLAQATGARQPTFYSSAINGKPAIRFDGGDTMQKDSITGFSSSACAMFAVVRASALQDQKSIMAFQTSGSAFQFMQACNGTLAFTDSNAGRTDLALPVGNDVPVVIGWNSTPSGIRAFANGIGKPCGVSNAATFVKINVGSADNSAAGFNFAGDIAELFAFNRALSIPEEYALQQYLGARYGIPIAPFGASKNLVWTGNSLVAGNGANSGGTICFDIVPATISAMGVNGRGWRTWNFGVPGQNMATQATADPPKISGLYQPTATKNVLVIWEIINQLVAGSTPAQTMTFLQALITYAQNIGYSVVVGTGTPRTDFNIETNRLATNTLIRALTGVQIADVAAHPDLQSVTVGVDWADTVHLNNSGYGKAAPYFAAAILAA